MMSKYLKLALLFHISIFFVRILYVLFRDIDLSPEEAQYWLWSKHLDLSYYSKPPLIAYMNFISTSIFGDTELGIRINAVIIGFFLALITFYFTKYLFKDEKLAFFSSIFIYLIPAYDIASILFLTDTPLVLFWGLTTFYFFKAYKEDKPIYWILTGIFAGLGFLAKYSMVFFFPIALIFLFIFNRNTFKNKWFYISIFIAFLFTLPVIIWNIQNNFVSFKHVETLAGVNKTTSTLHLNYIGDYILGQIGFNSVFLFPFFVYALIKGFKERKKAEIFYLWIPAIFVFIVFLLISLKKRVYVNWPVFAYFSFYILTAFYIYKKKLLKIGTLLFALSGLSIIILFYTPILDKLHLTKLLPPEKDPTKRIVGWEGLGKKVENEIKSLNTDKYFIFSDSYQVASELAFYVKPFKQTYCINLGRRMNQFDLWKGINQFKNKNYYGIYVTYGGLPKRVKDAFKSVVKKTYYSIVYRGKEVYRLHIYILKDFKYLKQPSIYSF